MQIFPCSKIGNNNVQYFKLEKKTGIGIEFFKYFERSFVLENDNFKMKKYKEFFKEFVQLVLSFISANNATLFETGMKENTASKKISVISVFGKRIFKNDETGNCVTSHNGRSV